MKKVGTFTAGVALIATFSLPVIYQTITRRDLDSAAGMLLMLYGVIIFLSELVKSPRCSQVANIISYLTVSIPFLYMLFSYKNSSEIPVVIALYATSTALATAIYVRNIRALENRASTKLHNPEQENT